MVRNLTAIKVTNPKSSIIRPKTILENVKDKIKYKAEGLLRKLSIKVTFMTSV